MAGTWLAVRGEGGRTLSECLIGIDCPPREGGRGDSPLADETTLDKVVIALADHLKGGAAEGFTLFAGVGAGLVGGGGDGGAVDALLGLVWAKVAGEGRATLTSIYGRARVHGHGSAGCSPRRAMRFITAFGRWRRRQRDRNRSVSAGRSARIRATVCSPESVRPRHDIHDAQPRVRP